MTYQKDRMYHKFYDTEPLPPRMEIISAIAGAEFEKVQKNFEKNPVRTVLGIVYMMAVLLIFCVSVSKMQPFGVCCAVCMIAALFIVAPFLPDYEHRNKGLMRGIAAASAIAFLALTVFAALVQFDVVEVSALRIPAKIFIPLLLCGIVLAMPIYLFCLLLKQRLQEGRCTREVVATIIGYDCTLINGGGKRWHRRPRIAYRSVYRYSTYMGECTSISNAYLKRPEQLPHIGDSVVIYYNPDRPDEIRITEKTLAPWGFIAALGILIVLFAGGMFLLFSQVEFPADSRPSYSENNRTVLDDKYLNKLTGSEAWRIALRTVSEVEDESGQLCIHLEKLATYADGTYIAPQDREIYANTKVGDTVYWVQTSTAGFVFPMDQYVYEGSKTVFTP